MNLSRSDIEFTFIRSLAHSGFILSGPSLSPEDRRERIRIAIMKAAVGNKPLPTDPSMTYSQAYQLAYNRPCELRQSERETIGKMSLLPVQLAANAAEEDLEDDEEADSGLL